MLAAVSRSRQRWVPRAVVVLCRQPLVERMVAALLEHRPPQLVPFVRKWLDHDEVPLRCAALAAVASTHLYACGVPSNGLRTFQQARKSPFASDTMNPKTAKSADPNRDNRRQTRANKRDSCPLQPHRTAAREPVDPLHTALRS